MDLKSYDRSNDKLIITFAMHALSSTSEIDLTVEFSNGYKAFMGRNNYGFFAEVERMHKGTTKAKGCQSDCLTDTPLVDEDVIGDFDACQVRKFLEGLAFAENDFEVGLVYATYVQGAYDCFSGRN